MRLSDCPGLTSALRQGWYVEGVGDNHPQHLTSVSRWPTCWGGSIKVLATETVYNRCVMKPTLIGARSTRRQMYSAEWQKLTREATFLFGALIASDDPSYLATDSALARVGSTPIAFPSLPHHLHSPI